MAKKRRSRRAFARRIARNSGHPLDALAVSCPRCYARANEGCVSHYPIGDWRRGIPCEERTLYYREALPRLQREVAEREKIEADLLRGRLEKHRQKLDPDKPKAPKSGNPPIHQVLGVGASLLQAASGIFNLIKTNPSFKLSKAEQAFYNKRIHDYIRQGYSGAQAGTLVKQEIMKRKNPKQAHVRFPPERGRKPTSYCQACGEATFFGKPYCSEHIELLGYVPGLQGRIASYAIEEEKLASGMPLAKGSPVVQDIVSLLREGNTVGIVARHFQVDPKRIFAVLKQHKIPVKRTVNLGRTTWVLDNPGKRGKRAKKKNPLLAVIGNPGPRKRKKNFDIPDWSKPTAKAGKGVRQVGEISLQEAKKMLSPKAFKEAIDAYVKFHGYQPSRLTVYEVPDGSESIQAVVTLGLVPEMHYFVPPEQKTNKNEEGETHWVHHTKDGEQPALVYNPSTQMTMYLPPAKGGFRVDDFLRESDE